MRRTTTFICLQLWLCAYLFSQPVCRLQHYSVQDGLGQRIVTGLLQDRNGVMWFSSWNGLDKFDGYTFRNYKGHPGDGSTLNNNRITSIRESAFGDIWCISHDSRLYLFDTQREQFLDVLASYEQNSRQTYRVQRIYTLRKGVTWVLCEDDHCFRIDEQLCKQKEGEGVTFFGVFDQSLKGEKVMGVKQDADGDEWIFTNKGVTLVGGKRIESDFPFKYHSAHENTIWLASAYNKLATYNPQNGQVTFKDIPYRISNINMLKPLNEEELLLGTNDGIILYNIRRDSFSKIDVVRSSYPSNHITKIYQDSHKDLWIFTKAPGVARYERKTEKLHYYPNPARESELPDHILQTFIYEDPEGHIWLAPQGGNLTYYDRESNQLKYYYADPQDASSRFAPFIRDHCIDRQNNLWLNVPGGVSKLSFFPEQHKFYPSDDASEVRSLMYDRRNYMWMATKDEKIKLYNAENRLEGYLSANGTLSRSPVSFGRGAYCMKEDSQGNIWIGTRHHGLCLLTRDASSDRYHVRSFRHNPEDIYSLSSDAVYSVFEDSRQRIWIGCHGGGINLIEKDPAGHIRFIHPGNRLQNYPLLHGSRVRYITEVPGQVMMAGTTDGLFTFSADFDRPEEIRFHRNTRRSDRTSSLSNNDVMQIFTDSREDIYLVTFSGGINRVLSTELLSDSIRFESYTVNEGLASDLTLSMLESRKGDLWIISENALTRFDPESGSFDNFDTYFLRRDIQFSECIPAAHANGTFAAGSLTGVVRFDPDQMSKSAYTPPILFTGMRVQGEISDINLNTLPQLTLHPSQRTLILQYAALDYVSPEEIRYAYRLKGLEEKWNQVEKSRSATYINLPKGRYTFQVRSTNSDGEWTDNVRELDIELLPMFRETIWAILLYLALFVIFTLATVYVLIYIYNLKHKINLEQELSHIKLRFFTDISHELRTPLTLIASPVNEVLEKENISPRVREHLTLVQKNTDRMLNLINQLLDFRKIQNRKMKLLLEETEVNDLLQRIRENFLSVAEEKHIDYRFLSSDRAAWLWIDKDKFEKIVFNLLSNAFKYTPEGRSVTLGIEATEQEVTIFVRDNGIGIGKEKLERLFERFENFSTLSMLSPSSGIGLSLVKEFVDMHHSRIEVTSVAGEGSEFRIRFRTGYSHFEGDPQVEFLQSRSPQETPEEKKVCPQETIMEVEEEAKDDKLTILVVEDNEELQVFLKNILSEHYTVIQARNGKEGLDQATRRIPDILISDVMMPEMDGLEMVRHIKNNPNICHIPIVLLTAKSALDDRIHALEQGVDDYITKPFSASYLKTRIQSLLKQRKLLQEIYRSSLTETVPVPERELAPSQPHVTPYDEVFIRQVMEFMEKNMDNADLAVDDFADALMLSRTVFYRKLKSVLGMTPTDFIREIRIKRALQLIATRQYTFSQIAFMTGFNDPKYFSKCFKKQVGCTPSEYKEKIERTG